MTAQLTLVSTHSQPQPQTPKTMSSREIAELTGKEHKNVLADIRNMLDALNCQPAEFTAGYLDSKGEERLCYNLPRDLTITLVTGYSIPMRHRIVTRWQELEAQQQPAFRIPQTMAEALRLAADQQETIEQQQVVLAQQAPKVEFMQRFVEAENTVGFRELCKLLSANEARFREFLLDEDIMYKQGKRLIPYKQHVEAGRVVVLVGASEHGKGFTHSRYTMKGVEWLAGEWSKYRVRKELKAA